MCFEYIVGIIGAICTVAGVALSFIALSNNRKKDNMEEGQGKGSVHSDIGYIKAGIDDIKTEQRELRKESVETLQRLSKVEGSAASAHKRIDRIEGMSPRASDDV